MLAEKNLAVHIFWLRELLNNGVLTRLRWADTRDITADVHTKGAVERHAILRLIHGQFSYEHEIKDFVPKIQAAKTSKRSMGHQLWLLSRCMLGPRRRCLLVPRLVTEKERDAAGLTSRSGAGDGDHYCNFFPLLLASGEWRCIMCYV